ncbi:peptidoglycan DD-metalloendopeptidase family protein [Flavobacterium sp.]|uniref:peptidoglycan DD-metalloendopeptidase family protein n=1 Tax=Flavobacterium sp. TaxID=239 RepID=UPI00286E072A|nr:peptidoglycan DD-metalloendopeptidase family protein [Flavobacterium sp.]
MKKITFALICISLLFSCKKEIETVVTIPEEIEATVFDFDLKLNDFYIKRDTIKKEDTFQNIIEKQNLNGKLLFDIITTTKKEFNLSSIRKGKPYLLLYTNDFAKKLEYFIYQPDQLNYCIIDFRDSIVRVEKKTRPITFKSRTVAGQLNGSLSESLKNEGASTALTSKLVSVYKWSIDFFKSKKGDKFAVTFTERYINDSIYDGVDTLQAAFFEYKGKKTYAFPFMQNKNQEKIEYYDENGNALKNFFLKAPLKSINITSKFSRNRFHPVQMRFKAHNGTDYAAPRGTPIMSTANGVVEQSGYTAGNGNFVKVKHDKTYATQYLHMSRILVRRGQQVKQGDVIGKVGSTGLATGPHVCYRFWKNGKQVDALKLKLPNSIPMDNANKPRFLAFIAPLKQALDSVAALN